jgi:excisionase family DNA binding protein
VLLLIKAGNTFVEGKMGDDANSKLILTVEEARKALGLSRGSMYQAIASKQISSIRIGKRILIPRNALTKLLEGLNIDNSVIKI